MIKINKFIPATVVLIFVAVFGYIHLLAVQKIIQAADVALSAKDISTAEKLFLNAQKKLIWHPAFDKYIAFQLAEIDYLFQRYDDAKEKQWALIKDKKYRTAAFNSLIQIALRENNLQEAQSLLIQLKAHKPGELSIYSYESEINRLSGNYETALKSLDAIEASSLSKQWIAGEVLPQKVKIYVSKRDFQLALRALGELKIQFPKDLIVLFETAKVYEYLKDKESAQNAWNQFMKSHQASDNVTEREKYDAYAKFRLEEIEKGNFLDPASSAQIWGQI